MNVPTDLLIAEDNPALGVVVQFNLERAGFKVTLAENGCEAWDLAQARDFQLVITDQQMPGMTGVELCQRLRGHPRYSQTPIIMLTAKGLELKLNDLKEQLRIAAVLPKPFSPRELIQKVTECLQESAQTP